MSEIIRIGKKSQIVIPKKIRNKLNLKEGERIFIDVIGDVVVLMRAPKSVEELAGIGKGLYERDYINNIRSDYILSGT